MIGVTVSKSGFIEDQAHQIKYALVPCRDLPLIAAIGHTKGFNRADLK